MGVGGVGGLGAVGFEEGFDVVADKDSRVEGCEAAVEGGFVGDGGEEGGGEACGAEGVEGAAVAGGGFRGGGFGEGGEGARGDIGDEGRDLLERGE